jgi:hypothetical protein
VADDGLRLAVDGIAAAKAFEVSVSHGEEEHESAPQPPT